MTRQSLLGTLAVLAALAITSPAFAAPPRLLVLTDIGGDPDDQQSMRRLMLYTNEFQIEGLIASASGTPGEVGSAIVRPELIRDIVDDYEVARVNLVQHATGYATADALRNVIKSGNPNRGVTNVGAGKSTAGSNHIINRVDASQETLHVSIWGGATDLAQALFDVRATRTAAEAAAFRDKLRVYAIADQDKVGSAQGPGEYIRSNFPDVRYIEAGPPSNGSSFAALFRGMYQNDSTNSGSTTSGKTQLVKDAVVPLTQEAWVKANVVNGHGPLGAGYPIVNQNPDTSRNTSGVKEGDTPSWFYLLPNGLSDPDEPTWGGWGGRFKLDAGEHYIDGQDKHFSGTSNVATQRKWTVARWREAYQNDFAARMDWAVTGFADANHNPIALLNGDDTLDVLKLTAHPDETVTLSALGSSDPDGDNLLYRWWIYDEAGTYAGPRPLTLSDADTARARLLIPQDALDTQIHVILEVTDTSAIVPLTSYRRAVLDIVAAPVPEPASVMLFGIGSTALLARRRSAPHAS